MRNPVWPYLIRIAKVRRSFNKTGLAIIMCLLMSGCTDSQQEVELAGNHISRNKGRRGTALCINS